MTTRMINVNVVATLFAINGMPTESRCLAKPHCQNKFNLMEVRSVSADILLAIEPK